MFSLALRKAFTSVILFVLNLDFWLFPEVQVFWWLNFKQILLILLRWCDPGDNPSGSLWHFWLSVYLLSLVFLEEIIWRLSHFWRQISGSLDFKRLFVSSTFMQIIDLLVVVWFLISMSLLLFILEIESLQALWLKQCKRLSAWSDFLIHLFERLFILFKYLIRSYGVLGF